MSSHRAWLGSVLVLGLLLPVAVAQPKKKEAPPAKDKKDAVEKMIATGEVTGRLLVQGKGAARTYTLRVQARYAIPNPLALGHIQNLQAQMAQVAANRTLDQTQRQQQLQNLQMELVRHQQSAYSYKEETQDIDLQVPENVKVRLNQPRVVLDDNGNPKKYTAKELRALKGPDARVPGYPGVLDDVQNDQLVSVTLARKARPAGRNDDGKVDKPVVTTLLIVAESAK